MHPLILLIALPLMFVVIPLISMNNRKNGE